MLQNIRDNAQGTIAKTIVGLIVLTFALFGVESIVGGLSGEPEVASVNGESITQVDFQRQLELRRRQVINQMGENYDPALIDESALRSATLTDLIAREVRMQAAAENSMAISEETIDSFILQWPPAQVDGKFSRDQFLAVLRNIGVPPLEFREQLKKDLLVNQLRNAIAQSSFVIDDELMGILRLERQKRTFDFLEMDAAETAKGIEVSEGEIEEYYNQHTEDYRLPEQLVVNFIEVSRSDIADTISVTDEELRVAYENEVKTYVPEEQRRAAHILVETSDEVSDEQALEKINGIAARIADGEDFAELAKESSDDLGSAQAGGDLGFASKGSFVPEFDETLFKMEKGEVSQPVKSEYGYHIIKLLDISRQEPPTFEEARIRITSQLKNEKAETRFVEIATELTDATYSATDLKTPADELGLTVKTSEPFSRDGGDGLFSSPAVLQQAFSDDVLVNGHNSEVVEVGRDTLIVVRKNELLASHVQSLAEVKPDVKDVLALQKAKQQILTVVDSVVNGSQDDATQLDWKTAAEVRRSNSDHGMATKFAFTMPKPEGDQPQIQKFETPNGYIVVSLKSVVEDVEDLSDVERRTYKSFLANRQGVQDFESFDQKLQQQAEIERL